MSPSRDADLDYDVLLVGAGVMSATVAAFLAELEPGFRIGVLERLDHVAGESSDARNNAGTGHAALCELNYTPRGANGLIDVSKALKIMECFEVSKQGWAHFVESGLLREPGRFIRSVPHLSFVRGAEDAAFLEARHQALLACPLFAGMRFSRERAELADWLPLMMQGREPSEVVAVTRSTLGTDVDFGELARGLLAGLASAGRITLTLSHEVRELSQEEDRTWVVGAVDLANDVHHEIRAKFVFLGAGGGALELLERSGISEARGYAGFPVSGQWLVCENPALVARHHGKVYGKARVGAPPMSVPHLDSRVLDGGHQLMFGPFAGFSTKFQKEGSYFDLLRSLTPDNVLSLVGAGLHNLPLTRYLVHEVMQSFEDRIEALREFVPEASPDDWELAIAGQRVQVIKHDEHDLGRLEFGTEILSAKDNSLAALLGASPGASTSISIALELLDDCFPERMAAWRPRLAAMIPSYGKRLADEPALASRVRATTSEILGLRG